MRTFPFDTSDGTFDQKSWEELCEYLCGIADGKWEIDVRKPKRTIKQNSAMHLFFQMVADELNGVGVPFTTKSITKNVEIEHEWTGTMVKEFIWRPIQIAKLGVGSTTGLSTVQIDEVADPIIRWLGTAHGIGVQFPSEIERQAEQEKGRRVAARGV